MVVDVGVEVLPVEVVNQRCPVLWDMGITKYLAYHMSVLTLRQGIVVGLPRPGFSEFDTQLFQ